MANNHNVPEKEAKKWIGEFDKLKKGLKINCNNFFLEKQSWDELSGPESLSRIRVYFGLEAGSSGKFSACAYAVSTIIDKSGIYRDQIKEVYKLEPKNINSSSNLEEVKKQIQAWREWRKEESATEDSVQKKPLPLFPIAFLLHADDLKELFAKQGKNKIKLEFGMDSGINFLMSGETLTRSTSGEHEYFDFVEPCPPVCDPESPLVN
jgi:hypothetical protein